MMPNKCKCGWFPVVFGLKEPVWGITTHYKVICENCGRNGKYQSTREEAIEEWNNRIAYLKMISCPRDSLPRKIKITSKFAEYLDEVCKPVFQEMSADECAKTYTSTGAIGRWDGIPIEIDDTIENEYYEIVYEEN